MVTAPVPAEGERTYWLSVFDKYDDPWEVIGIAIGAASMCWENPASAGEFKSTRAAALSDALFEFLRMRWSAGDELDRLRAENATLRRQAADELAKLRADIAYRQDEKEITLHIQDEYSQMLRGMARRAGYLRKFGMEGIANLGRRWEKAYADLRTERDRPPVPAEGERTCGATHGDGLVCELPHGHRSLMHWTRYREGERPTPPLPRDVCMTYEGYTEMCDRHIAVREERDRLRTQLTEARDAMKAFYTAGAAMRRDRDRLSAGLRAMARRVWDQRTEARYWASGDWQAENRKLRVELDLISGGWASRVKLREEKDARIAALEAENEILRAQLAAQRPDGVCWCRMGDTCDVCGPPPGEPVPAQFCAHHDDDNYFDRTLCAPPCAVMHTRCRECHKPLDPCAHDVPPDQPEAETPKGLSFNESMNVIEQRYGDVIRSEAFDDESPPSDPVPGGCSDSRHGRAVEVLRGLVEAHSSLFGLVGHNPLWDEARALVEEVGQ